MKWPRRRRNIIPLSGCILLAIIFIGLLYFHPALTGNDELNGLSGVFLGLFICSQPAANFLDLLLLEYAAMGRQSLRRSDALWIIFNSSVLLTGLIIIVIGTKLFFKNWQ